MRFYVQFSMAMHTGKVVPSQSHHSLEGDGDTGRALGLSLSLTM